MYLKRLRKLLCLFFCFCMVMGLFSVSAYANDDDENSLSLQSNDTGAVTAVKLLDTDGTVWGHGINTGSSELDDVSWNQTTGENKGYDSSSSNNIIRSFDSINYVVTSTFSDLKIGNSYTLFYEVTLPDDDELTLDEAKMNAMRPIECQKNNDGTKTYICKYALSSEFSGGDKEENIIVKVGNKHQDYVIRPTIKAYLNDSSKALTVNNMEDVIVTSAPMYNIVLKKKNNESIVKDVYDFSQNSDDKNKKYYYTATDPISGQTYIDNKVTGYKCTYGFALEIKKSGSGIKGVELPDDSKDFSFDIDLSDGTLNGKNLIENGFNPLLYYVGPNEPGGGAITELPFTKPYVEKNVQMGCYDSGNISVVQEGSTLHVNIKGYQINQESYPKQNYSGTSYWEDLDKIREGIFSAFQFHVVYPFINQKGENIQEKIGSGTFNVKAKVKNMSATSQEGTTSSTETNSDDNHVANTWEVTSGHGRNQQIFYSSRQNMINPYSSGQIRSDGDVAALGANNMAFTVSYIENNIGEADNRAELPVAIDQLVLFDRNILSNVEYNKYMQQSTSSDKYGYDVHIRYAVLKNGSHLDNESMKTVSENDFNFFDTKPEGGFDAVLIQYRGTNLAAPNMMLHAQFNASVNSNIDLVDKVYMITALTKVWTASDFKEGLLNSYHKSSLSDLSRKQMSDWAKQQSPTQMVENKTVNGVVDNRNMYTVPEYVNGVYTVDANHKFSIHSADALYIVPYTTTVTKNIAQTDDDGNIKTRYNIGKGERYVDYKVSSSMKFWTEVDTTDLNSTTVYFEDILPEGLTYIAGSSYWGGTYSSQFPQQGKVENGKPFEPTITTNENGQTVLKWAIDGVQVKNGQLPDLHYSCKISKDVASNQVLQDSITIQTNEDKRSILKENDNTSSTAISITRDREFYIVKRGGENIELQDNSYYELVASNTSSEDRDDLWLFDTMPYNGGKSKKFEGQYKITSLTMDANDVNHASDMEVWYTNESRYIGKTAKDIPQSEVTETNGWKKAKASGFEGDTISFTGEGLIGSWPAVIVYKDAKLEQNTIATLKLAYEAVAGAEHDAFTNIWSTMSNGMEIASSVDTFVYNRTLEGTVWYDSNQDGIIDQDEKKLKDVKVTLLIKDENDVYIPYTPYAQTIDGQTYNASNVVTTDKNGHYKFTGLPAGNYRVKFESSDGQSLGYYDVTKYKEGDDVTKNSKVENDNVTLNDEGDLNSGTIQNVSMSSIDTMVNNNKNSSSKKYTYNLPNQNLGLIDKRIDLSVKKEWQDIPSDQKRTDEVEITLYTDGKETETVTLNNANNWHHIFENLLKYDSIDDHKINYTFTEKTVDGYKTDITNSNYNFTVKNIRSTSVHVEKIWNDNDNIDKKRQAITVKLYKNVNNKKTYVISKQIDNTNQWQYTFKDLPKYEDGKLIDYTVEEDSVKGYSTEITKKDSTHYVITNTKVICINAKKEWVDNNNSEQARPDSVTIHVMNGDKEVASKTLSEANSWQCTFDNLPQYDGNKKINYTIKEDKVNGYKSNISGNLNDGYVITNTQTTSITGKKIWDDNNNQDGKRLDKIIVNLFKTVDGKTSKVKSKNVTQSDDWKFSFNDLPKYEDGKEITYSITEDAIDGYTSSITGDAATGFTITNTHIPEKTSISGTKTWDDNNDQDGKRPDHITVNVMNGSDVVASKEVTAADNWSYTFDNLDKYKNGQLVTYTILEEAVDGYTTSYSEQGYDITNIHIPGTISIPVEKVWNDSNNQDGKRSDSVTVKLLADGVEKDTLTLDATNNWKSSFNNLPVKKAGIEIGYSVKETTTIEGYTTKVTGNKTNGFTIANSHTPELVNVSGSKTWNDGNNQDGIRPDNITVRLLANGQEIDSKVVNKASSWKYSFNNLPKYENGKEITYTITENAVKGYTTKVDGYNVKNTHTPEETSIPVEKVWNDGNNQDGKRSKAVTIQLLADGAEKDTLTLNADNSWKGSFNNLPVYKNGKKINYTIKETTKIDGYSADVTGDEISGFTVTNSYTPETTSVTGTKTWDDKDNQDSIRPATITVNLVKEVDGIKSIVESKVVTADHDWKYSFNNLPKYETGKEITYSITEDAVDGYTTKVDGYNITNTHKPGTISIPVEKVWNDANNQDGKRSKSVTIQLLADGVEKDTLTLNADNNWKGAFNNLPVKKAGKEIVYSVKETTTIEGYTPNVTGDKTNGFTVTNSHTPETTSISGTKTWDDKDNQDGIRPESITVKVMNGKEVVASKEVTAKDNWSYTFDGLAKYNNGQEIAYTVSEDPVEGYTTTVNGYNVTNTHTPETTKVAVTKKWNDHDNIDQKRPTSLKVYLYADGKKTDQTIELNEEGDWSGVFDNLDKYKEGKVIEYSVEEEKVERYEGKVTGNQDEGFVIINTYHQDIVPSKDDTSSVNKPGNKTQGKDNSNKAKNDKSGINTGDHQEIGLFGILGLVSMGGVTLLRKRKED